MKALREILAAFGLLFAIRIAVQNYSTLPQRIPTHFDANGLVNGWGDKSMLWEFVGIACIVYIVFSLLRFLPQNSIGLPVGPEERAAAVPIAMEMFGWLKAESTWILAAITWSMAAVAQGRSKGLIVWTTPALLLLILATVSFYLFRIMSLKPVKTCAQ